MQAYLILALMFFAGIAVFVFQNPTMVTVHFINWTSPKVSIAEVALVAACAGAILVFLVDSFRYFKVAKETRELTQANRKLQNELKSLKGEKTSRKDKKASDKGKTATSESVVAEASPQSSPDVQLPADQIEDK
ncbi:MAG: LapA family protein [Deltaproteobacteria bacterium]